MGVQPYINALQGSGDQTMDPFCRIRFFGNCVLDSHPRLAPIGCISPRCSCGYPSVGRRNMVRQLAPTVRFLGPFGSTYHVVLMVDLYVISSEKVQALEGYGV